MTATEHSLVYSSHAGLASLDTAATILQEMGMQKVGTLRRTRHTVLWFVRLLTVGGLALGLASQPAFGSVVYTLDFSQQPDGPATNWLKDQGFVLKLNAEELHPYFRDGRLILH